MPIGPNRVTEQLAYQSHQDCLSMQQLLSSQGLTVSVKLLETSAYPGSVFRGDTEILVEIKAEQWSHALSCLNSLCQPITELRSKAESARFRMKQTQNRQLELMIVKSETTLEKKMSARIDALKVSECRSQYDAARLHVGDADDDTYARVKKLFWDTREKSGPQWVEAKRPVLKILRLTEWEELLDLEETQGAPIDIQDGYVHFSTPQQVIQTARKHFSGEKGLWLLTLDAEQLNNLKYEVSRGGDLFPHLYSTLKLKDVCLARPWCDSQE